MSSLPIFFPSAKVIVEAVSDKLSLIYYERKTKIAEMVAKLAAERFANQSMQRGDVSIEAALIIEDLQNGENSFSREKFSQIKIPQMVLPLLFADIEAALLSCQDYERKKREREEMMNYDPMRFQ